MFLQIKADRAQGEMEISGSFGNATEEEVVELTANIIGGFLFHKYQDVDFEKIATLTKKFGHNLVVLFEAYENEQKH